MKIELILGDALVEMPRIKAKEAKFVIVTDPPFNVGYHYNTYKDDMDAEDYFEMLQSVFQYGPFVVVHYPEEIYKIAFQVGEFPDKVVSWVYNSNTPRQHRDIAFFGVKPDFRQYGQPYKNLNDKRILKLVAEGHSARLYDWWEINQVKNVSKEKTEHPCQMPLEVMKRIIGILPIDYTIVDPFMGSGTTGLACKLLNRNFVGIELDKKYFEIAQQRINV
jgi:site-specific DNA-methyltransferase (adenine-specific)